MQHVGVAGGIEQQRSDSAMPDMLGVLIAERRLECRDGAGKRHEVVVRIGKPVLDQEPKPAWYCPFSITGMGGEIERKAFGEDSVQALLLGLQMIGVELEQYERTHACTLTWHGIGVNEPGFPPLPRPLPPEEYR